MKKTAIAISVIIGTIILDQLTKGTLLYLITGGVPLFGGAWEVVPVPYLMAHVCDIFNFVFTWNPGTSQRNPPLPPAVVSRGRDEPVAACADFLIRVLESRGDLW